VQGTESPAGARGVLAPSLPLLLAGLRPARKGMSERHKFKS
jgi:hypothetical protein